MINPEEIKVENNKATFVYNVDGSDKTLTQIYTVLDISNPYRPKAIKSFVDEYSAIDYADEFYLKENHDCLVVRSSLNVSMDETNY